MLSRQGRPRSSQPRRRLPALSAGIVACVALGAWFGADLAGSDAGGRSGTASTRPSADRQRRRPRYLAQFNTTGLLLPAERIRHGGPAKDGIPALVHPGTAPVAKARFLRPDDRVVGVAAGGAWRAYPIRLLNYHEAVNDTLGDVPIAVIYCPLCDSVSVVDRRVGEKTLVFGISGLLYNSNVLLYDRTDNALWSQVRLTAVSGPHAGQSLRHLKWELTGFGAWKRAHPKSTVVTFRTGHSRRYGRNPYARYFADDRLWFPVDRRDSRLGLKARVVGVQLGERFRAYPLGEIRKAPGGRVREVIDGKTVVLEADPAGKSVRVVEAPGQARVIHTFWFAWSAFHPSTEVYRFVRPAGRDRSDRSKDK